MFPQVIVARKKLSSTRFSKIFNYLIILFIIQLIFVFPFIDVLYKGQLCKTDTECKVDDFARELENERRIALQ